MPSTWKTCGVTSQICPLNLAKVANLAMMPIGCTGSTMQTMTAKDAKYGFGRLIDLARSAPVTVEKHGRPVVVVLAVEEFERLKSFETALADETLPNVAGKAAPGRPPTL